MKKAIVVGASSGIGHEVARLLIAQGWAVGVAARRIDKLTDLQTMAPERVYTAHPCAMSSRATSCPIPLLAPTTIAFFISVSP